MRTIGYLIRKEFIQIFRNRFISKAIFAIPIVQLLVLVPAVTFEINDIEVCIVDHDMSAESRKVISSLQGSPFFIVKQSTFNDTEAVNYLHAGKCDMVLTIPEGFGESSVRGFGNSVMVSVDAVNATSAQLSWAYISGILQTYNISLIRSSIVESGIKPPATIEVRNRYWYNPELQYKHYMLPGVLVILVTAIGLLLAGLNVVREKEIGTIEQLNVTPIRKYQFIIAKLVPFLVIGLIDMAFGLILGKIFFHMPINGSIALLFAYASLYLIAVLGLALFFSTISSTQQQYLFVVFFILMIFVLMSGIFTPAESMPRWANSFNVINPASYFMRVIRMVMLKGSGLKDISGEIIGIALIGISTIFLSVFSYRKRA